MHVVRVRYLALFDTGPHHPYKVERGLLNDMSTIGS